MTLASYKIKEFLKSRVSYPLAREYDVQTKGAVNMASNESPYGPSQKVVRVLKKEIELIGTYPDPKATLLKKAIGQYIGAGAGGISVGNGSDELMDMICKAFLDPGDRVLIPTPTFSMYELSCRTNGGKPIFYNLPNFEWTEDILRAAKGAKIVFLGRPNNPTGNSPNKELIRKIAVVADLVVVDEAYVEFAEDSVARWAAAVKNVIVLRTFSKAFGLAGLRVGYAVSNPKIIQIIEQIRAPFNVNRIAQTAALTALKDMDYVAGVVGKIKSERKKLYRKLTNLGLRVFPSDANFLMVDVSVWGLDSSEFCDRLAEEKIFVRDLSGFRGAGKKYVRITVGTPRQNNKLISTLEKFRGGERVAS